jgi:hypothetical protein
VSSGTVNLSRPFAPPSVLPDISPTLGEISRHDGFRQSPGRCASGQPISLRVGGPKDGPRPMARAGQAGRTEGGNVGGHLQWWFDREFAP